MTTRMEIVGRVSGRRHWTVEQKLAILRDAFGPGGSVRAAIEQVFAKLKHLMRKAAERTHDATWRRIGSLLDAFSPTECRNYLLNSGYGSY